MAANNHNWYHTETTGGMMDAKLHELIHRLYKKEVDYTALLEKIHIINEDRNSILTEIILFVEHLEHNVKEEVNGDN